MTKVKICGLSTKGAVETAVSAGADYIGFVFAPSKRQVTLEEAAELATLIPVNVKKVGVFVSPSRAELLEAIEKVGLDLVQVHSQVADDLLFIDNKILVQRRNVYLTGNLSQVIQMTFKENLICQNRNHNRAVSLVSLGLLYDIHIKIDIT